MKKTKQRDWNIFKGSKYLEDQLNEDRESLNNFYNESDDFINEENDGKGVQYSKLTMKKSYLGVR